jgi:hypothetical protein
MLSAVILGLALALACALATSVSFLLKQRGAVSAAPVRVRHPLRSAAGLFRSKWFAVGWLVAVGAWGLHVGALEVLVPEGMVQLLRRWQRELLAAVTGSQTTQSCWQVLRG